MKIENVLVGKAIARLRALRGLTQSQLNRMVGMSTIQHIEQGRNAVSLACLDKIATALDFPPACILLLGSRIEGEDRVLSSLHSLLEATFELEQTSQSPPKKRKTRGVAVATGASKRLKKETPSAKKRRPKKQKPIVV